MKIKCPSCGKEVFLVIDGGIVQYVSNLEFDERIGFCQPHTCKFTND